MSDYDDSDIDLELDRDKIGPWWLWNVNRKSYVVYRMVKFSMTVTDL